MPYVHRIHANLNPFQSQQKRTDKIRQMLVDCRGPEAKFVVKALQGKMRIGLGPKTVMVSAHSNFSATTFLMMFVGRIGPRLLLRARYEDSEPRPLIESCRDC